MQKVLLLVVIVTALSLSGCAGSPAWTDKENIHRLSDDQVCRNLLVEKSLYTTGVTDRKLSEVYRPELVRRMADMNDAFNEVIYDDPERLADDIINGNVYVGQPEFAAACAWYAHIVNVTQTKYGVTKMYKAPDRTDVCTAGFEVYYCTKYVNAYFWVEDGSVTSVSY